MGPWEGPPEVRKTGLGYQADKKGDCSEETGDSFPRSAWECRPGRSAAPSAEPDDAERRRRHSHAERGNESLPRIPAVEADSRPGFLATVSEDLSDPGTTDIMRAIARGSDGFRNSPA